MSPKRKKILSEEYEDGEEDVLKDHDDIVEDLKKGLGDVAYILGRGEAPPEVNEWLSTGSTILDAIISNNPGVDGGIPVGRLTEIYGQEATGKSLLAYMILKDCQRKGGVPILIDTENSANITFLKMLGLNPEDGKLIYIQVDTTEEVFSIMEKVITKVREASKDRLVAIVWDSVAGTSTKAELEGEYGDATIAMQARLISQGLRKIMKFMGKQRIAAVFLNQVRMKIGSNAMFGDPMAPPGGKAIPFWASVRIRLSTNGKLKAGKDVIGVGIKCKLDKNRMGPPFRECALSMYFDKGIIDEESWLEVLQSAEIVHKTSAQKSSVIDKETGEILLEFKNKDFVEVINRPENSALKSNLKKEIKKKLYIEQDPYERDEDIVVEVLEEGEIL